MSDWRDEAACRDVDPELFFPIGHGPAAQAQIAEAKAICARCPVLRECLGWALESGQDAGVWGGLTEEERRQLRRGERVPTVTAPTATPGGSIPQGGSTR